jgi:hypothetical protein
MSKIDNDNFIWAASAIVESAQQYKRALESSREYLMHDLAQVRINKEINSATAFQYYMENVTKARDRGRQ